MTKTAAEFVARAQEIDDQNSRMTGLIIAAGIGMITGPLAVLAYLVSIGI